METLEVRGAPEPRSRSGWSPASSYLFPMALASKSVERTQLPFASLILIDSRWHLPGPCLTVTHDHRAGSPGPGPSQEKLAPVSLPGQAPQSDCQTFLMSCKGKDMEVERTEISTTESKSLRVCMVWR